MGGKIIGNAMRRYTIGFSVGALAILAIFFVMPVFVFNSISLLAGGGWAHISRQCDDTKLRCIFVRSETGIGVDDVPILAIYKSRGNAARPSLVFRRIECDPGAKVTFAWEEKKLLISSEDGSCQSLGTGDFGLDVLLLNK